MSVDWLQVLIGAIGIAVAIAAVWAGTLPGRAVRKGEVARLAFDLLELAELRREDLARESSLISRGSAQRARASSSISLEDELRRAARVASDEFALAAVRPGLSPVASTASILTGVLLCGYGWLVGLFGVPVFVILSVVIFTFGGGVVIFGVFSLLHRGWRRDRLALVGVELPRAREVVTAIAHQRAARRVIRTSSRRPPSDPGEHG